MMKTFFHFGYEETILFKFWNTSSALGLLLAFAIIGLIGFLTEASTHINSYLMRRERRKNLCYDIEISPIVPESLKSDGESQQKSAAKCHSSTAEYQSCDSQCQPSNSQSHSSDSQDHPNALYFQPSTSKCPASPSKCGKKCRQKCSRAKLPRYGLTHFVTTLVYAYQTILNIFLMLSFMTYNVWLCLAVVIGRMLGYAFLQRIRT